MSNCACAEASQFHFEPFSIGMDAAMFELCGGKGLSGQRLDRVAPQAVNVHACSSWLLVAAWAGCGSGGHGRKVDGHADALVK
jgi:hypothetical protein